MCVSLMVIFRNLEVCELGISILSLCIVAVLRTHVIPNFICVCNLSL